jgi:hypothetical protein
MSQPLSRQDLINAAISGSAPPSVSPQAQAPAAAGGDLVQRAISMPQEEVTLKQRALIGLIKEDPQLVADFLKKEGFDAVVDQGEAKIKDRSGQLKSFNPEGIDLGDFLEFAPEIFEGIAGAAATSARALGAIGAPLTGGAGLAAGAAVGGAVTGGTELGKQVISQQLGLREDIDVGRVGRQAALGAGVTGAVSGLGKAISAGRKGLGKIIFGGPAAEGVDVAGVKSAAREIGAKPTPGMLTEDPAIRATEAILSKQNLGVGGSILRGQVRANQRAAIQTANELVQNKTSRSAFEVGEAFQKEITESVNKKLLPAETLYGEVTEELGEVLAVKETLNETLINVSKRMKFSDEGTAIVDKFQSKLDRIKSLDDLKLFRSSINDEISATAPKNARIVADELYQAATKDRTKSLQGAIRNLKGQFAPKKKAELLGKIQKADKIWAETSKLVNKSLLRTGKTPKTGVKRTALEAIEQVTPEKRLEKFLPRQDAARAEALQQLSPKAFDELSRSRIADIADRSISTARGGFGQLNPQKVASEIDKLSPEIANKMFGKDGVKKSKALAKFYRAIPADINPSGTATTLDMIAFPFRQITSASLSALNLFLRVPREATTKAGLFGTLSTKFDLEKQQGEK